MFLGYPVYVVPVMLLSNYFTDMFLSGQNEALFVSLASYYPALSKDMFTASTEKIYLQDDYPAVCFKNAYRVNGGLVIASSIYNMSTICQIMLCSNIKKCDSVRFIHFILLTDEYEQALSIDSLLGLPADENEFSIVPKDSFLTISYLKQSEIGEKERLFHIYGYKSLKNGLYKKEPRYSLPVIYHTEDGSLHDDAVKKQLKGFYDVAGYTDFDESVWERITNEYETQCINELP